MSRSVHTKPRRIRAARRVRAPYAPRGRGDVGVRHAVARMLKELGIVADAAPAAQEGEGPAPLPRLRVKRPREGYTHPATRADVVCVLRFFGEQCMYGLRSIEFVPADAALRGARLLLGTLLIPGRIIIYEQPLSPWLLPGRLSPTEEQTMQAAGAIVECISAGGQTAVTWPGSTLRDFMLFDVLMHEVGHHIIQQYKGKRGVRLVRTKDHEAFAAQFAQRCRRLYCSAHAELRCDAD